MLRVGMRMCLHFGLITDVGSSNISGDKARLLTEDCANPAPKQRANGPAPDSLVSLFHPF